jgi:aspartate aminotransferase
MLHIPLSGIKKIEAMVKNNPDFISLSQGSIKVGGIPAQIKKHVQKLLDSDQTDYYESCWGIEKLRQKIVQVAYDRDGVRLDETQVIPTHGCMGGLSILFLMLLDAGDEVIIPEPSYPAYTLLPKLSRSNPVLVACFTTQKKSAGFAWVFDVEKIKAATTSRTKIIIFSNPWNPMGIVIPKEDILELISWCEKRGIYLIIDEAYRDYDFSGTLCPGVKFMNQSDMVISANTFSKNFSMSGWRIGYLALPKKLSHAAAGMQDSLLNCLNNVSQHAALYALEHPALIKPFYEKIKSNFHIAEKVLNPLVKNGTIMFSRPRGGFFLFIKTNFKDATGLCMEILNKARVGMVPGKYFGPSGFPFIRLCYAREKEILEEGLRRIVEYFKYM